MADHGIAEYQENSSDDDGAETNDPDFGHCTPLALAERQGAQNEQAQAGRDHAAPRPRHQQRDENHKRAAD